MQIASASHLRLHLGAVLRRCRVHPLGIMTRIVAQDRATHRFAAKFARTAKVSHAIADIGVRIVQPLCRTAIAKPSCGLQLDLHKTDFTGRSAGSGTIIAFNLDNSVSKIDRHPIAAGIFANDIVVGAFGKCRGGKRQSKQGRAEARKELQFHVVDNLREAQGVPHGISLAC